MKVGKPTSAKPIRVDLFAGVGGFSLGFEQAGFDVLAGGGVPWIISARKFDPRSWRRCDPAETEPPKSPWLNLCGRRVSEVIASIGPSKVGRILRGRDVRSRFLSMAVSGMDALGVSLYLEAMQLFGATRSIRTGNGINGSPSTCVAKDGRFYESANAPS